jgi:hypothetical protein
MLSMCVDDLDHLTGVGFVHTDKAAAGTSMAVEGKANAHLVLLPL